jgi:hypothetical protein
VEEFVKQLGAFWGPAGIICGLQFIAIVYLYKALQSAQKEHVETLKANLPLMEKFESTMSNALRAVSVRGGDR